MAKRLTAAEREQQHFPGTGPEKNQKVHKAAQLAQDKQDAKKDAAKAFKEAMAHLLFVMEQEKVPDYKYDRISASIELKKTVKVKSITPTKPKKPKKPRKKKEEAPESVEE